MTKLRQNTWIEEKSGKIINCAFNDELTEPPSELKGTPLPGLVRTRAGGAGIVGKAFGVTRVPVVKNQALSTYDPPTGQGIGVSYATSTMDAGHTAGYAVATNILKVGGDVDNQRGCRILNRNVATPLFGKQEKKSLDLISFSIYLQALIIADPDSVQPLPLLVALVKLPAASSVML